MHSLAVYLRVHERHVQVVHMAAGHADIKLLAAWQCEHKYSLPYRLQGCQPSFCQALPFPWMQLEGLAVLQSAS